MSGICTRSGAACVAALVLAAPASADVSDVIFRIDASNAGGSGSFQATLDDAEFDADLGGWTWSDASIPITDDDGDLIALLDSANTTIIADPVVSLGFALTAGASDVDVTISSAVLSFPPIDPAEGAASVGVTVTELNGDTASVTGAGPDGGIYRALYNDTAEFAELLTSVTVSDPFDSVSDDAGTGLIDVADAVSSMSTSFSFSLSAEDAASATSVFAVVPEPAGLLLALVGLALIRRP